MKFLYNFLISSTEKLLPVAGGFNDKLKLFTEGRKSLFEHLAAEISNSDRTVWIHAASLGEYEQAVPVIKELRHHFPEYKIVISFFSPSGYEVKKESSLADVVTYLPLDTRKNARRFLDLVHPELVMFVKYEFWPNFLDELANRRIKSLLVSGAFRRDQAFFKFYGKWMRKYLSAFDFFFLQNQTSLELLQDLGFSNAVVSGDTRYDRVFAQLSQDNHLHFIEDFLNEDLCIVAGSTWPEDEDLILEFINSDETGAKFIIAPHTIKKARIKELEAKLQVPSVKYSEREGENLKEKKVFIIDTIGLLTRIYNYADIAFVGGASGTTGLHNVLEPAAFGVPIIIGKHYEKFPEAAELLKVGALFSVENSEAATEIFKDLVTDKNFRTQRGLLAAKYIANKRGATEKIMNYLITNSNP